MIRSVAAGFTVAIFNALAPLAFAQSSSPATPIVGSPVIPERTGPPARVTTRSEGSPRTGPLPDRLSLAQALDEAYARSPTVVAAEAELVAAEARGRQAGYRQNPELSLEVENIGGTGQLSGLHSTETTVAVNQRLDLGGRRASRVAAARADIGLQELRLAVVRAEVASSVRQSFARAIAAQERLAQANENVDLTKELARVASKLVDEGREPPLRGLRARSALAQAQAQQEVARAEEISARSTLGSLLGSDAPVGSVAQSESGTPPPTIDPNRSLEVRVATAEVGAAQAALQMQVTERTLDPAVGLGVRHIRETGDVGLVAGVSVPLRVFDRNTGNIEAARANVAAAEARQHAALLTVASKGRNATADVEAAQRRLAALQKSAVPEAREALRLARLSWTEGRATLVELLDAQNAYLATQASLTDAELALALAMADLSRIGAE